MAFTGIIMALLEATQMLNVSNCKRLGEAGSD